MPESYSFSPQFATIRSASPLEGMRPVKAVHTALQFQPQKFLEVKSEQPELVSSAWASGLKEGVGDALKGITAAFVDERKATRQEKKENLDRFARIIVAQARGSKGAEEDKQKEEYEAARLQNIKLRNEALTNNKEEDGGFVQGDEINASDMDAYDVSEEEMPSAMWDLGLPEETEDVLNPLTSVRPTEQDAGPTEQEVQALWSRPLSDLIAEASPQKQYDQLTSTSLAPVSPVMSTDVVAGKAPVQARPRLDINTRSMSLMTPQERSAMAEQFYAETGEMPLGMGALAKVPLPERERQQIRQVPQQPVETEIGNLVNDYANAGTALKAQKRIAERLGPEYHEAKIERVTKKGKTGFRVNFPERKTDEELKKQKDSGETKKEKLQQFQLQSFENVNRAQETLADLEQQLEKVQNKLGPISGRVLATNPYDADVQILQKYLTALVPTIARGVYGEVGVLTEADVNNYKQLIPNITQDPANAKATLEFLKRDLQRAKKNKLDIWEATNFDIQGLKKFITPESESENLQNLTKQKFIQIKEMQEGEEKEQLKKELKVLVDQLRATQKK